jgi:hypothetical protein
VGIAHPVLQQMQWNAKSDTKLLIKTKFLEAEKDFTNVLSKVAANELLTSVVERTSTIGASIAVKSGAKKFSVIGAHSFMHASKLGTQSFNVFLDVDLQSLKFDTIHLQRVQYRLLLGKSGDPVRRCSI